MKKLLQDNLANVQELEKGLEVRNLTAKEVGILAYKHQLTLFELKTVQPTLEELFTEITAGKVDYVSRGDEIT